MPHEIMIQWEDATEYIDIEFDRLKNHPPIPFTQEHWADGTDVTYKTTSTSVELRSDGTVNISLIYERHRNRKVATTATFGTSVITFKPPYLEGKARWIDDKDDYQNGVSRWTRSEFGLTKKKKVARKVISQLERKQAQFRGLLIRRYGCCVITGETTKDALEAAHIIPSKDGGAESLENGILLRADIHRLYDSGAFTIDQNGEFVIVAEAKISPKYRKILLNKTISAVVLKRIRPAIVKAKDMKVRA